MTREDIECIIKWFSHIEQLATDGKTANGFQMPPDKILATIKVVAKDSRECVEKFCYESTPNDLEEAVEKQIDEALFKWSYDDEDGIEQYVHDAFIAGAKWQKEQMMEEAAEGQIVSRNDGWNSIELPSTFFGELSKNYNHGEKVRVIVLPKED